MAGIDKTYASTYKEYKEVRDWAISVGVVTDDYGNEFRPFNYFYNPDLTEEEFLANQKKAHEDTLRRYAERPEAFSWTKQLKGDKFEEYLNNPENFYEVVIWNTDEIFDIYLMRHCPIELVQRRLREQYGEDYIKDALEFNTKYDKFVRPDNKNPHFSVQWDYKEPSKRYKLQWWISLENAGGAYFHEKSQKWKMHDDPVYPDDGWAMSVCTQYTGDMSMRKVYRLLRRWNLPKGTKVRFAGDSRVEGKGWLGIQSFTVTVK